MMDVGPQRGWQLFFCATCPGSQVYEWTGVTCLRLLYHIAGDLGSVYLSILAEWGMCSNGRFLHSVGHGCLDHDD